VIEMGPIDLSCALFPFQVPHTPILGQKSRFRRFRRSTIGSAEGCIIFDIHGRSFLMNINYEWEPSELPFSCHMQTATQYSRFLSLSTQGAMCFGPLLAYGRKRHAISMWLSCTNSFCLVPHSTLPLRSCIPPSLSPQVEPGLHP